MVENQLEGRDIYDRRVLDAMARIPRHEFVPSSYRHMSYEDHPLPIGHGQTISQPYIVALMTQSLQLDDSVRVLEVGTGSGYQAAVLSGLCNETYSVEIITELASRADETLEKLGYAVDVKNADGYFGWEEHAPYDAIIVTCAANHIPPPLVEQLKEGGRLVIPLGSVRYHQTLTLVKKTGGGVVTEYITGVRFVPMTGEAMEQNT
ncbi:MAG: protein-L-isoaspartate O-methyltransferase [Candidatus Altiarchaeales archaeon ex4484_2]|nr:MAG: protein-L-isoaspartate O-methyltransferase [Candidatus Altiarchaeales archaeon ex4484_2]